MAAPQLLFAGTYDNIDNAWLMPATVLVGSGMGVAATTGCFFSGPQGCVIEDVYYIQRAAIVDLATDVYLGLRIRYSSDGGASFTTVVTYSANADCPFYWDDAPTGESIDFVLDTPIKAFTFVGAGTGGLNAPNQVQPIHIPANVHVLIELAPVAAGSVIDIPATFDSMDCLVFGHWKG
ncbi:hypothetical protein LCGC14_2456150 [marine sediment metagenome]|uniref:Uncharacterized protein n=1 Tax=marine sediment metagenome TaxID=412755 RepID=A0A0F9BF58_9ZZZZ